MSKSGFITPEGYEMTEKAGGKSYLHFKSKHWSDTDLIEYGFMRKKEAPLTATEIEDLRREAVFRPKEPIRSGEIGRFEGISFVDSVWDDYVKHGRTAVTISGRQFGKSMLTERYLNQFLENFNRARFGERAPSYPKINRCNIDYHRLIKEMDGDLDVMTLSSKGYVDEILLLVSHRVTKKAYLLGAETSQLPGDRVYEGEGEDLGMVIRIKHRRDISPWKQWAAQVLQAKVEGSHVVEMNSETIL